MKFKLDENMPLEAASFLRGSGYDVHTVDDEGLSGENDAAIATRCRMEARALITLDLDFANIKAYPPASYAGIIVLRSKDQSKQAILNLLRRLLPLLEEQSSLIPVNGESQRVLAQALWIVEKDRVRHWRA